MIIVDFYKKIFEYRYFLYLYLLGYALIGAVLALIAKTPWFDEAAYSSLAVGWLEKGYSFNSIYIGESYSTFFGLPYAFIFSEFYTLFGFGHAQHRLIGFICLLASLIVIWKIVKEITGKTSYSNVVVTLLSLHHVFIWTIIGGRPETLFSFLVVFALYMLVRSVKTNKKIYFFLFGFFTQMIFFSHAYLIIYSGVFYLIALIYLIHQNDNFLKNFFSIFAGVLVATILIFFANPDLIQSMKLILESGSHYVAEENSSSVMLELKLRLVQIIKYNIFYIPILLVGTYFFIKSRKTYAVILFAPIVFIVFLTFLIPKITWYQLQYIILILVPISVIGFIEFLKDKKNIYQILGSITVTFYILLGAAEILLLLGNATLQADSRDMKKISTEIHKIIPNGSVIAVPFSLYFETKESGYIPYHYVHRIRGREVSNSAYLNTLLANNTKYFIFEHDSFPYTHISEDEKIKYELISTIGGPLSPNNPYIYDFALWYDIYKYKDINDH